MAYQKILVDNTKCWRRFHLSFDDESQPVSETEVKCLHCGTTVFAETNHPPVLLARDENLIKTNKLSPYRTQQCSFTDTYSPKPQPK